MRSPTPAKKTNEILNELADYLKEGEVLTQFQFHKYVRDIENLKDMRVESCLLALANAAYGRKPEAIAFFEAAMSESYYDHTVAHNYLAYLGSHGSIYELFDLIVKTARMTESKQFSFGAFKACMAHGEWQLAAEFADKSKKLCSERDGDGSEMILEIDRMLTNSLRFKENAGFNDEDYSTLSKVIVSVLNKYHQKFAKISLRSIKDKAVNSYMVFVDTKDSDMISEMNMDMALSLAEHDEFLNKQFSVWFLG